jgi:hypothetical protein
VLAAFLKCLSEVEAIAADIECSCLFVIHAANEFRFVVGGDAFGIILTPKSTLWATYNNPEVSGISRPIFSMPEANATPALGNRYMLDLNGRGTTFGFEDQRFDAGSDKDHNDVVFRLSNAKVWAANFSTRVNPLKDTSKTAIWRSLTS